MKCLSDIWGAWMIFLVLQGYLRYYWKDIWVRIVLMMMIQGPPRRAAENKMHFILSSKLQHPPTHSLQVFFTESDHVLAFFYLYICILCFSILCFCICISITRSPFPENCNRPTHCLRNCKCFSSSGNQFKFLYFCFSICILRFSTYL